MKTALQIIVYVIKSALFASIYFIVSYKFIFIDVAKEDLLSATIWNIVFIFVILTTEKIEAYAFSKIVKINKNPSETPPLSARIKYLIFYDTPLKTSLYFFFIILLICSAIVSADPDFPILGEYGTYLNSIEYGLLTLIAVDAFYALVRNEISKEKETLNR